MATELYCLALLSFSMEAILSCYSLFFSASSFSSCSRMVLFLWMFSRLRSSSFWAILSRSKQLLTDAKGFSVSSYFSLSLFSIMIFGSFFILLADIYFLRAFSYIFFVAFQISIVSLLLFSIMIFCTSTVLLIKQSNADIHRFLSFSQVEYSSKSRSTVFTKNGKLYFFEHIFFILASYSGRGKKHSLMFLKAIIWTSGSFCSALF